MSLVYVDPISWICVAYVATYASLRNSLTYMDYVDAHDAFNWI